MIVNSSLAYLRAHWAGRLGLGWSFWVNLVAIRLAISSAQSVLVSSGSFDYASVKFAALGLGIFFNGLVFGWQVVGVLRAADQHIRQLGTISSTWGAQLGIVIAFWIVLTDIWGLWIVTRPQVENIAERLVRDRADRYQLSVSDDGKTILLTGDIALGITDAVTIRIAENPSLETLVLTSNGGNIYAARGLAKLVRDAGIGTVASGTCSSACTVAFIGGVSRRLQSGGRLGFHQYRLDADYTVPFADPRAEEARDLELFRKAGVQDWFLMRMFRKRPDEIWYPAKEVLYKAGVLVSD